MRKMCVCVFVHEYSRFLHILVDSPFFFLNAEVSINQRLVGSEETTDEPGEGWTEISAE